MIDGQYLLVAVGVTVLALLAVVAGATLANTPSGATATPVTATQITRATLGKFEAENKGIEVESGRRSADLAIVGVVIEPRGPTGWHHPGVILAAVKSGAVTFYDEDCQKSVYRAGEEFLESHDEPMLVRNKGDVKAVFYMACIIPTSTPPEGLRIDDPRPRNCNVR